MKTCVTCNTAKSTQEFEARRAQCKGCRSKSKKPPSIHTLSLHKLWIREKRRTQPSWAIVVDAKAMDRNAGYFKPDIDEQFVIEQIQKGCQYCGNHNIRMTLDRINNDQGHNRDNVIPCCFRCNWIRGSMPYEAWLLIVPGVKEAYEKGLFGDWRSVPLRRQIKD